MLCYACVFTTAARLLAVIICWIMFVSLLADHLQNTARGDMWNIKGLLPSEKNEIISLDVPHHFTEAEVF